ncbi:MAG: hypothetical protein O7H41_12760 [Planctomycetota bacterium]|nr:hypothetical protein [Planctomycetota bacterium]
MPRQLWLDYDRRVLYARYNVPVARGVILDTVAGAITPEFLPIGSSVKVEEFTADQLAVGWQGTTLFLCFRNPNRGFSVREQIERVFAREPGGTRMEWIAPEKRGMVRRRFVGPGMTTEEVELSWGPPPRSSPGPDPGVLDWLYPTEGDWYTRVRFRDGVVTFVTSEEGDAPLIPHPYPRLLPEKKRPHSPY